MRTFRIGLVLITTLGLGCLALFEGWLSLQTGVVPFPFGRHSEFFITFARTSEPGAFYSTVALWCTIGLAFLGLGLWWLSNLAKSSSRQNTISEVGLVISGLEQKAPSGLRPLWIGLLIFGTVMLVLYAVA